MASLQKFIAPDRLWVNPQNGKPGQEYLEYSRALDAYVRYLNTLASDIQSQLDALSISAGLLSTTGAINAKSTGTTALYTAPLGKTAIITAAMVRCTAAIAITVGPTLGIGVAAGEDDIFSSTAITALTTTSKTSGFSTIGMSVSVAAASVIKVGIDTASTGTSQTIAIDLMGYLI